MHTTGKTAWVVSIYAKFYTHAMTDSLTACDKILLTSSNSSKTEVTVEKYVFTFFKIQRVTFYIF